MEAIFIAVVVFLFFAGIIKATAKNKLNTLDLEKSFSVDIPYDIAFNAVLEFSNTPEFEVGEVDENNGTILLYTNMTAASFGEFFPIKASKIGDCKTDITIGFKMKFCPIKSKELFEERLDPVYNKLKAFLLSKSNEFSNVKYSPDRKKRCPYCAENIQFEARKCRYCGSSL